MSSDIKKSSEEYMRAKDHKAWAKKIMARNDRGDKTLLPIQIQFARQALGLEK